MSINTICIDGNVGRPPEFAETSNGNLKVSFSFAHKVYGASGEETDWFNVQAFGKTAETIQKLGIDKGSYVAVSGRMRLQSYERDGEKKVYPVIWCNTITVKGKRADASGAEVTANEDIPF